MNVVCYYQPIEGLKFSEQSFGLLERWKSNWASKGWNPIVLNESHANQNKWLNDIDLDNLNSCIYNSSHKVSYTKQCLNRWFAYTNFVFENGPTVWSDYDIYNYNLDVEYFNQSILPDIKSLFSSDSCLLCKSASTGIMNESNSNMLLELIKRFSQISDPSKVKYQGDFQKNHLSKVFQNGAKDFSDMWIATGAFYHKSKLLYNITSGLMVPTVAIPTLSEQLKKFNLFHLHGSLRSAKNVVFENEGPDKKVFTRTELWDYFDQKVKYQSNCT